MVSLIYILLKKKTSDAFLQCVSKLFGLFSWLNWLDLNVWYSYYFMVQIKWCITSLLYMRRWLAPDHYEQTLLSLKRITREIWQSTMLFSLDSMFYWNLFSFLGRFDLFSLYFVSRFHLELQQQQLLLVFLQGCLLIKGSAFHQVRRSWGQYMGADLKWKQWRS